MSACPRAKVERDKIPMTGIHDLWLFVLSGLLLNMTPGVDTLYIVARGAAQGWRAGAVAARQLLRAREEVVPKAGVFAVLRLGPDDVHALVLLQ